MMIYLFGPLLSPLSILERGLITSAVLVLLMTYLVMPIWRLFHRGCLRKYKINLMCSIVFKFNLRVKLVLEK